LFGDRDLTLPPVIWKEKMRKIYYIDVGNISPDEALSIINGVSNKPKSKFKTFIDKWFGLLQYYT